MAASDYTAVVQQLYVSYFGRPADTAGLANFAAALNDMGAPTTVAAISAQAQAGDAALSSLINSFTTSTESINQFGTGTTLAEADAFVAAIFQQVLNRAPTVTGLDNFWVKAIVNNELTLANASLQISAGALANTSVQGLLDAKAVENKVQVATNFTAAIDTPAEVTAFKGATAAADAKALLAQVTATTDVVAFQATVESTLATIVAHSIPGQTFTLTTGVDALVGGAGVDAFTGVVSALSSDNTLNVTDVIDGGAGSDTLNVALNSNFTGFTTGSVKNVETVNLTNTSAIARTFDASGVTGVERYTIDATKAAVSLVDLAATVAVSLSNQTAAGTFSTAFATGAAELTGTADAMTLALSAVGKADDVATTTVNEEANVAITLTSIETANVEATGSNVVSFGGATLKTLKIAGAGDIKVTAVPTSLTSFDASGATGKVTADITATTSTLTTIATGSGDDSLTFNTGDAAANATLSGGAGADALTLDSGAKTVQYVMSGFETLNLGTVGGDVTFSGTSVTGLTTVSTKSASTAATSLVNMGAGNLTFVAKGATVDAGDLSSDHTGTSTLNYTADATSVTAKTVQTTAADFVLANTSALTVNVGAYTDTTGSTVDAAKATSLVLNVASGKDSATTPAEVTKFNGVITAAKATSITVDAQGALGATAEIVAVAATGATVINGATAGALKLTTAALENLNVTTGAAFDLTASTLTALQTLTVAANVGHTQVGPLAKVANVTLSGAGTTALKLSQVTLGNLGGANDYNLALTATGLKGGLNVGTLSVNTGYNVTAEVGGVTGAVVLGAIGAVTAGTNVTVNAVGVGGTLNIGAIIATGDVSVKADNTVGAVTLGKIIGNNVTLDVSNTIGGVTYGGTSDITAKTSANVDLSSLQANTVAILAGTGSTALTTTVNGGILVDNVSVTGVTTTTAITLSGDLGLGTDVVTVTSNSTAAASTINLSGLLNYDAAAITGGSGKDTITGGAGADTIIGGLEADTIIAGEGADIVTIGAGQDTVSLTETTAAVDTLIWSTAFAAGNANAATVTGFAFGAGADVIDINVALKHGTLTFAAGTGATNTIAASAPVAVASNGTTTADTGVVFTFNGAGDLLAAGTTSANAVANAVTALTSGADFAAANIAVDDSLILQMNDGTNTFVFEYVADVTAATTTAADLTLIGVFNGTTVQALVGDFI